MKDPQMNRIVTFALVGLALFAGMVLGNAGPANKTTAPPEIEGHGKVTPFADAPEQPRDGSKIVVDLTAGGPPDQLNKGLEKVARFVNIYSQAGKQPARAKICVVLHGEATGLSLNDAAHAAAFQTQANPNLPLVRKLRNAGVEFLVCGQALTLKGYQPDQTTEEVQVAVSGLTALVNRQQDGYAYVPLSK
jgi:hypothetical protein